LKIIKQTLIVLATTLSIFAANSIWYAVIMRRFYENSQGSWMQVSRENLSIPVIILGIFVLTVLMTVLYHKVQMGIRQPVLANLAFGMLVGLIYVFPSSLTTTALPVSLPPARWRWMCAGTWSRKASRVSCLARCISALCKSTKNN